MSVMDDVLRCSRYAFGPNRLMYCGPDANNEMGAYLNAGATDKGLEQLLSGFEVLYPYLVEIAARNGIASPFDARVVDAYWIGNSLLDRVDRRELHRYFIDALRLKDRMTLPSFRLLESRVGLGMQPSHNFHVINVPKRMGHLEVEATPAFMDSCRVSWGKVLTVSGPKVTVEYEPLVSEGGMLRLGTPTTTTILRALTAEYDIDMLTPGQWVSMHWGIPCEVLSEEQIRRLRRYTLRSIAVANATFRKGHNALG